MEIKKGLTFKDVLLEPKYSEVRSRKGLDLTTNLTRNIKLHIPIISSNMDTVTDLLLFGYFEHCRRNMVNIKVIIFI